MSVLASAESPSAATLLFGLRHPVLADPDVPERPPGGGGITVVFEVPGA
ncbi:hypothetical protein [Nocardia harenae]|nr:hypothetical protein [Nocardia harenae]